MFIINALLFFSNSVALVSTRRVHSVCHLSAFHTQQFVHSSSSVAYQACLVMCIGNHPELVFSFDTVRSAATPNSLIFHFRVLFCCILQQVMFLSPSVSSFPPQLEWSLGWSLPDPWSFTCSDFCLLHSVLTVYCSCWHRVFTKCNYSLQVLDVRFVESFLLHFAIPFRNQWLDQKPV